MDKLGVRKLKSKAHRKKAASAKWYMKWQAATFFTVILISVIALCVALVGSGAKSHPVVASKNNKGGLPVSATPPESPKVEVDPFLPISSAAAKAKGPRRLANTHPDSESLARKFLAALAGKDIEAIKAMRLTEQEFCNYVWHDLPSSRLPNVSCDWAWNQATIKSLSGLGEMLRDHQGRRYEFLSLRFAKGTEVYPSYKVHKETWLRVRDENGGEQELRLFGSILEMDGKFKLFSFVVD